MFGSLSVVLPEIMRDTGLSSTGASMLTTLPILCLGLFSLPTPALARRFGAERILLLALLLIAGGTLLRHGQPAHAVCLGRARGAGIAMGNVLLPGLIKRSFASRVALMMGLYTLAVCAGHLLPPLSPCPWKCTGLTGLGPGSGRLVGLGFLPC